ncbi:molybdate ABC transporter substrate-binding protein [Halomonas halmophila]|uniref:Molybdate ABC transporter substrate-binding protein n=1 Tax=Halomonas halmophila TaxID=252 RepID=A0A4Y4F1T6_9GAMM|nr:molybdate ABC transporter substrate-binding protein [Halomonas halmophila]GED21784.1 molybdate ABC transporter substrate-binding protein [Halomonas halmophila]
MRRLRCGLCGGALALLTCLPTFAVAEARVELFAAASMTDAIDEALVRFEASHDVDVVPVYAASSTLARQIAHGAPAEVYIPANVKWMDWLGEQGVILSERTALLHNRLALIAPQDSPFDDLAPGEGESLADRLADGERLAVGDPAHVPAGIYARQALESLGEWQALSPRLARAANVRAALALVARGEAPLGVVYRTDALASDAVRSLGLFPESAHPPITYPIATIGAAPSPAALELRGWLESEEAMEIFKAQGFR